MSAVCPNGHTSQAEDYCDICGTPIDASTLAPSQSAPAGSTPAPAAQPGAGRGPGASGGGASGIPGGASSLDLDAPAPASAPSAPSGLECPNCHTENAEGALFCEACGYDFTTGAMPRRTAAEAASAALGESESEEPGEEPGEERGEPFEWVAEVWVDPDWYATQEAADPCPSPGLPTIIPLRHTSLLLGRVSSSRNTNPEIDLSTDPGVSRRHAQLTTDGSRWFVSDLDSSNGTFVGPASGPLPEQAIPVGPKRELDDDDRLYVGAWTRVVVRKATPEEIETFG